MYFVIKSYLKNNHNHTVKLLKIDDSFHWFIKMSIKMIYPTEKLYLINLEPSMANPTLSTLPNNNIEHSFVFYWTTRNILVLNNCVFL
jgi:hypothetical protein